MLFAFFDLINELRRRRQRRATRSATALLFVALHLPVAHLRALPGRGADRHAVRDLAAGGELRVHGDARVGRVAAAGGLGAWCASASRSRVATFLAGEYVAPPAERLARQVTRGGQRRLAARRRRAAVRLRLLVQAGPHVRQHPQRARRHDAGRRAHLRVRPRPAPDDGAHAPSPDASPRNGHWQLDERRHDRDRRRQRAASRGRRPRTGRRCCGRRC